MDMRIEAAPMTAEATMPEAVVTVTQTIEYRAVSLSERVVSFSCPSISGHSLSAVAPDSDFKREELALGVAA